MKIIVYPKCEIAVYNMQIFLLKQGFTWNSNKSRKQQIRRNIRVFEYREDTRTIYGMGNSTYSRSSKMHIPRKKRH